MLTLYNYSWTEVIITTLYLLADIVIAIGSLTASLTHCLPALSDLNITRAAVKCQN